MLFRPESLTVEGPANRMISNFKYLLERHIIAIMVNALVHNIKMLDSLDRCGMNIFFIYLIHNDKIDTNISSDLITIIVLQNMGNGMLKCTH